MKAVHPIALAVISTLTLACVPETVVESGKSDRGISFATRLEVPATRGTVTETPSALASAGGFNVWAFSHEGDWETAATKTPIMEALPVTSSDSGVTWSYGTAQDWPLHRRVSFFAYGPRGSASVTDAAYDGTPQVNFTVKDAVADQIDLLISEPVVDQRGMTYSGGGKVNILFKHALARISFSGLVTDPADTRVITVKEITLNDLYPSGTTALVEPAKWMVSMEDETTSYTVSVADGTLLTNPFDHDGEMLTDDDGYLFLVPQLLARDPDDPTMDVTLEVDGTEVVYSSLLFSPQEWRAGHSYNYQLSISENDLRIVVVDTALELVDFEETIMENAIYLTSDADQDTRNLTFAMDVLNRINGQSATYGYYPRMGLYAVNDVTHDITIDMATLPTDNFTTAGQYLILDLRKLVRSWGTDPSGNPWTVSLTGYESAWSLEPSKQAPNDVDASTGATNLSPSDSITGRGTFILKKK
jgi:hypothetical protein